MDKINFLLTEVSLELLGNKFYDIHGMNQLGLTDLFTANIDETTDHKGQPSDIVKALGIEHIVLDDYIPNIPTAQSPKIIARRASSAQRSFTISSQKTAAIQNRRNTVYDVTNKPTIFKETPHSEFIQPINLIRPVPIQTINPKMVVFKPAVTPSVNLQIPDDKINYIKQKVKKETKQMLLESEKAKEKYFEENATRMTTEYLDEHNIDKEYHTEEKMQLLNESNVLIEYIKFVKCDPKNIKKMSEIAATILNVKDQI